MMTSQNESQMYSNFPFLFIFALKKYIYVIYDTYLSKFLMMTPYTRTASKMVNESRKYGLFFIVVFHANFVLAFVPFWLLISELKHIFGFLP